MAVLVVVATSFAPAYADVRRSDVVIGQTVEERGISASACPSVDAEHVVVIDDAGQVYFTRDPDTAASIASITKIMTAIVALDIVENYDLLNSTITVSARAALVGESSAELLEGDTMSVTDALKALMIPSGNDAAVALAENLGAYLVEGESTDDAAYNAFVAAMNDKAAELGCTDTVFTNPHGLDSGTYAGDLHSTASDLAKIVLCAMQDETFRDIVKTKETTIEVVRAGVPTPIEVKSTDELLGVYEGACGIKTGYTALAGSCFAGASYRDGRYLYAIVLDSPSDAQRFEDTRVLYDWVYDNYVDYRLANSDVTTVMDLDGVVREVPVVAEVPHQAWTDKTVKATLADPDASIEVFALAGNVSQSFDFADIEGDVHQGDVVGTVTFYQAGEEIASEDLISTEDVAAPNFIEGIGIWWARLITNITGSGQQQADTAVYNDTPLIYDKLAA